MSRQELDRQYRGLKQMIAMHSMLRDEYRRWAVVLDLLLLAASVIFCATTFACDYISKRLGVPGEVVTGIMGVASVTAFFAVLAAMVLDWKGKAARHGEAVKTLTNALAMFRETRAGDGWAEDQTAALSQAYWDAANSIVPIPDRRFTGLKAKYLRKVEVSRTAESMPGCPFLVVRFVVFCRSISRLVRRPSRMDPQGGDDGTGGRDGLGGEVSRRKGDGDPPRVRPRD